MTTSECKCELFGFPGRTPTDPHVRECPLWPKAVIAINVETGEEVEELVHQPTSPEEFMARTKKQTLTSSDPEPPVGTIVRDDLGRRWVHAVAPVAIEGVPNTYWLPMSDLEHGDAESWNKVAGNYGPVRVIR